MKTKRCFKCDNSLKGRRHSVLPWILAASALMGTAAAIYFHYIPPVKKERKNKSEKWALLLGCPTRKDGSMSTSQILRCNAAIEAWEKGMYNKLVISGGAVKNEDVEALVMKEYIDRKTDGAIPIQAETEARNTWENFQLARKAIGDNPVLIITSSLHAGRSCAIAHQFFPKVSIYTYPEYRMKHVLREIASRWIYVKMEIEKDVKRLNEKFEKMGEDLLPED